jgi:DNA polymerase III delta prime subunit
MILEQLDKNNLHHAYLIEGVRDEIVPEILEFLKSIDINTSGNPDFISITIDNFKIDEAFSLRSMSTDKSFSSAKKIFLICVNSFSLDAQNVLLKMFEEPIENTHFFLVIPDVNALLKTLVSRFYLISPTPRVGEKSKVAEKFITMSLINRISFIKELLIEVEDEDITSDSSRSKALKFLNALEVIINGRLVNNFSGLTLSGVPDRTHTVQNSLQICLNHFLKVREFLRMPGSSVKNLMESVALIVPEKI